MIDKRVDSIEAALGDLRDGASVMISGFGGCWHACQFDAWA
jgi:acyl CoA:acetate/3-ketoacid CoA transferase alpha subunit